MYLDKLGLQDIISYQRLAWRRTQSSLHSLICSSQWFLLFNLNINELPIAWDRKLTGEISWIQKHISLKKHIFGNRVEWIICGWARLGLSWLQNFRFRVTIICEGKNFNDVLLKQHKIRNFNTFKLFVWYTSVRELYDGCHQIFRVKENAMSKNCFPKFASGEFHLTWVQFSLAIFFVLELVLADRIGKIMLSSAYIWVLRFTVKSERIELRTN